MFSNRHGFACDNVRNYEVSARELNFPTPNPYQVVIASGEILNVSRSSHPDLYWALRGGGNQFGIVTHFDLVTFPQGDIWGGMPVYPITANDSLLNAYTNFANNIPNDPSASLYMGFILFNDSYTASVGLYYDKPIVNPPIYHEFLEIPSLQSILGVHTLPEVTDLINELNPAGFRLVDCNL